MPLLVTRLKGHRAVLGPVFQPISGGHLWHGEFRSDDDRPRVSTEANGHKHSRVFVAATMAGLLSAMDRHAPTTAKVRKAR